MVSILCWPTCFGVQECNVKVVIKGLGISGMSCTAHTFNCESEICE